MKLILITLFTVLGLSAETPKAEQQPKPTTPAVQDRLLTHEEISDTLLLAKTAELEGKKIEESQRKIKDAQQKYSEIFTRACLSVGIAADKIQSECGFTTGIGQDDQVMVGQDGKPVAARVWKLPAQPQPQPNPTKP